MRRTRLGILILAAGLACFPLAFVAESIAPALLGLILMATTLAQRPPAGLVEVTRQVPVEVAEGEPFDVVIEAKGPAGSPLFLDAPPPVNLEVLETRVEPGRGSSRVTLRAVARQPGTAIWGNVRVRVQDAWGVVEEVSHVPLRDNMRVRPGTEGLAAGRAVRKLDEIGAKAKRARVSEWEPEIERLRDYQPGDRVRDIDWPHSTVLGKLITRERTKSSALPLVVLMQATSSVRWMRRVSKFETLRETALGLMAAAQTAGMSAGFVAYDDRGICAQVRVSASRKAIAASLLRMADMPSVEPVERVEASADDGRADALPTHEERAFLEAIAQFDPRASRGLTPLEAAIGAVARVSPQPALVVCLLDAEGSPALVKTMVQRLTRHGHRCIVAAPASGAHHFALDEVDDTVFESLVVWRRNREQARKACREMRVPFVTLGDTVDPASIGEVIRSRS